MRKIALPLPGALDQAEIWVDGARLEDMDRHHRSNLIPFLRGNKRRLFLMAHPDATLGDATGLAAEEWLAATPLMGRLVELERGLTIDERRETAERNAAHEAATGYQKIRADEVLDEIEADELEGHEQWVSDIAGLPGGEW